MFEKFFMKTNTHTDRRGTPHQTTRSGTGARDSGGLGQGRNGAACNLWGEKRFGPPQGANNE